MQDPTPDDSILKPPSSPFSSLPRHLRGNSPFKRSDSFRSDQTDASSEARRVSFNNDVQVKKIPKSVRKTSSNSSNSQIPPVNDEGPFAPNVRKEAPPTDAATIAAEAERILAHLQGVQCRASPTPKSISNNSSSNSLQQQQQQQQRPPFPPPPPTHPPPPPTVKASSEHLRFASEKKLGSSSSEECDSGLQGDSSMPNNNSSSSNHNESISSSSNADTGNNRLFGLHALNNLDIAVNGNNVNSMPGYQEVRRQQQQQQYLDSSGNSAEYSPQPVKRNQVISNGSFLASPPAPSKPPRSKAPSASPPSVRRGMTSVAHAHYAQPAPSERSTKMVSSMMEQLSQDSRFRRRMAETTDDDGMSGVTSSVYSAANRGGQPNYLQRMDSRESPSSRLSPSRTCMTDTELLRSPTEVLYAVSDKYRHGGNDHVAHSASQTNELNDGRYSASTYDNRRMRAASREDMMMSDAASSVRNRPSSNMISRSLDRYGHRNRVEDKENNAFKARIHVTSPDRASPSVGPGGHVHRKPYKTTINTANDDIIQYAGAGGGANSNDHHLNNDPYNSSSRRQIYQKNQTYRRPESEHYKVPKNKAPVEYLRNGGVRHPGLILTSGVAATDSDHSSSVYHRGPYNNGRLVRSADGRRQYHGGELDREGRTIRRDRGRTYSGCSTSPDREGSPDANRGYSRPRPPARSYSNLQQGHLLHHGGGRRSPSTSPTRPPRARSSPGREMIANVVRRVTSGGRPVERQPSNRVPSNSRSPFKNIERVHNNIRRETSADRLRAHTLNGRHNTTNSGSNNNFDDSEERLARFTEYRAADGEDSDRNGVNGVHRRGSSVAHRNDNDEFLTARERGRSLPPGANNNKILNGGIGGTDPVRDFYKSSQYKSMYALPPSPSRPAPVLDRAPSASTLRRDAAGRRAVRPTRVSISEGENTDNGGKVDNRPRVAPQPPARRASTKRQAPSPPGYPRQQGQHGMVRRVVSSDREDRNRPYPRASLAERRVVSSDRERGGMQHPPQRRVRPEHRRASMGDALDSSYSESEGFLGDPDQRPWSSVSEEEDCYDEDELDELEEVGELVSVSERLAPASSVASSRFTQTSAGTTATIVRLHQQRPHSTAILYDKTPIVATYTYKEKPLGEFGRRWASSAHTTDIDSDYRRDLATSGHNEARGRDGGFRRSSPSIGRSSSSAREEERRKVLEIEARRNAGVSRSASRVSRTTTPGGRPVVVRTRPLSDERDSQYSGHSSSSAKPGGRFAEQNRLARIKRSTSNATNNNANGVRMVGPRKKLPASLTSSLNSSESEQQANGAANGNRSVFLHSACVADIPPNSVEKHAKPQPRAQSAESRENNANTLARQQQQQQQSNLQKSKKISRSISLLAPWKRQQRANGNQFAEIHYDNNNIYGQGGGMASSSSKPPRPPPPSQRGRIIIPAGDKKSASSTNLLKTQQEQEHLVITADRSRTMQRSPNKVSRSVSMPKDTRLAGWFRKKKKVV